MTKVKEKISRKVPEGMLSLDEPIFKENQATDIELTRAYHWYGVNYDIDEGKKWLIEYLKNINTSREKIALVESDKTPMVACSVARIINRGIKVPERASNYLRKYIDSIQGTNIQAKKSVAVVKPPTVEDKTDHAMHKIEKEIDKLITGSESDFSFYTEARVENLSKNTVKIIMNNITPRYLQIKAPEYKEYYRSFNSKQLKQLAAFYSSIISDCERIIGTARVTRKPRKSKVKSAEKILKNIKYKKQDDEYKITSIDPTSILKASTLVVFNTKYRHMTMYVAEENKTLSVKGTGVINFDISKSVRKTIRKPQDVLKKMLSGMPTSIRKTFDAINTKSIPVTSGRINEEIILLRVS
jgi:hypothetical protein